MSKRMLRILAITVIASVMLVAAVAITADEPVVKKPAVPDTPEIEHGMGLIFAPEEILKTLPKLPLDAVRLLEAAVLPVAVDHSAGLPPVGDQGPKGTCTAWATTYYYRTFQEAAEHGWSLTLPGGSSNPDTIFSPAWTFALGGNLDDECSGMMIPTAFATFEERGATTLSVMPNVYSPWYQPTELQGGAAFPYRTEAEGFFNLSDYLGLDYVFKRWLSGYYAPYGWTPPEGDVFVIGIQVPDGFGDPIGTCPNMWVDPALIQTQESGGGHAITVIGYDDEITFTGGYSPTAEYVGGFQIINSWGKDYGCDGKVWFPYEAWNALLGDGSWFVSEAYGVINMANYSISGRVTSDGLGLEGVEVRLNNNPYLATTTDADGYYTLPSGYGGYTLTVKPVMEGYTFDPVVASLEVTEDTTGVDFVATAAAPDLSNSTKTVDHPVLPNTTPAEFTVNVNSTGAGTSFSLEDPIPTDTTYVVNSAEAGWGTVRAEGDLMAWEALPSALNTERYGLSAEIGQDSGGTTYVYAIGGHDTTTEQTLDTVERAAINPDGSLGAWEVMSDTLNTPRAFFDTVMLDIGGTDYIYVIAGGQGYTAAAESVPGVHTDLNTVERAPVNADGTVGPWETLASTLVITRSELSVVSDGNYVWAIGGINWDPDVYPLRAGSHWLQSVEYAPVNPDGTLGPWALLSNTLRETRNTAEAVIIEGATASYIELIGGRTGGNTSRAYGERAAINSDGTLGSWLISQRLHWGRYGVEVVAIDDYLYAVGGRDHGGPLGEVDRTKINADGSLFGWQLSPGILATPRSDFGVVAHDGRIYAIGGRVTEVYCADYYDRGSGCGYAIGSVEMAESAEPGTVWWAGELGEADDLSLSFSVLPQSSDGTPLPPGSTFVNTAEIEDSAATVTSVSRSVEIMDVDMERATKEVYPDKVKLGETVTFTITLPNDGGWSEVSVTDELPTGLEYVYGSAQASSGVMGSPGEVWEWTESDYGPVYNRVYFDLVAPGNGFLYAIGPWYDTEYAPINPDGSVGEWQFTTNMSTDRMGVSAVAPGNGYIYAVGGGPNGTDAISTTERAEILPDGSLGEWEVLESTLVYPRSWHNVVAPGNGYLYALSGYEAHQTTSYTSTEYCEIYPDGTLGPWQELEATVNHTRDMAGAVAYNGYIYIVGGEDWNLGSDATAEYAEILPDGTLGDFVVSPNEMNNARDTFGLVEVDGILYAIGGRQWGTVSGPDLDRVESAEILPDGSIGPWTINHGRLPEGLGFPSAEAVGDHIYVVDHWSAYYTEILDSVVWEGEVDYQGEAVLTFEAELVEATETETMINTATIEHSMGTLDRDATFTSLSLTSQPDLWVDKIAPAAAKKGDTFTYTIRCGNKGGGDAHNVWITDTLPADVTPTGVVGWNIGTVAAHSGPFTLMLPVTVTTPGVILTNQVDIHTPDTEAYLGDNSYQAQTVVEALRYIYLPFVAKNYTPPMELIVLHTNDEHGWLETFVAYGSPVTEGGAANLMGRFTQIEAYSPDRDGFLLLSSGDNWTGPSISTWFEGEPVVEVMNAMGYDVSVIGNHEFDFGRDVLNERIAEADFPFLSANIYYTGTTTLADFVTPYVIEEVNGVKVGIVGLTTTETPVTTHPKNITDLYFGDYEEALRREVPKMRAEGAELIIVESHVCSENLVPLAAAVSDLDIALMEGGHCHDTFTGQVGDTLILEAYWAMRAYGKTVFYLDWFTHDVVDYTQGVILNQYVTQEGNPVTPDPAVQAIVDYWQAETDEAMGEVIGYTETGIARQSWKQANYVTDSWIWAYPTGDFAMTNWGGFRADIAAGDITVGDIVGVIPFDNTIVDCAITGAQLVDNLECCGGAVAGFSYTYHTEGSQTVVDSVTLLADGSPLDLNATYHVLVNDFMYLGGSGYLFGDQDPNAYDTAIHWRQPVIDWTRAQNTSATNPIDPLIDDQPRAVEITP